MGKNSDEKIIFHIDVNSAFLSWSAVRRLQEDPDSVDLRTIPAVVGGDPTTRHGIVTAKSMPAKKYGIRTADTIASAMRRCPSLVVIPSDFAVYRDYSHRFMEILQSYTSVVEQASIDEAYMDATELCRRLVREAGQPGRSGGIAASSVNPGSKSLCRGGRPDNMRDAAVLLADEIRETVRDRLGFTVNVGISTNRLLAKMASDFEKPDKTHALFPQEVPQKLWPLPIGELYGCGRRTAERLWTLGIRTIGDAAHTSEEVLVDHLGDKSGKYIYKSSNGIGRTAVSPVREDAKSYSNEFTTSNDITEENYEAEYLPLLQHLCDKVSGRLKRDGVFGKTVVVTVKTDDFRRKSIQRRLPDPSSDAQTLYDSACALSDRLLRGRQGVFAEGAGIRLLGVGVTDLDDGTFRQVNLFDWLENEREQETAASQDTCLRKEKLQKAEARAEKPPEAVLPKEKPAEADRQNEQPGEVDQQKEKSREADKISRMPGRSDRLQKMEEMINLRYGEGTVYRGARKQDSREKKNGRQGKDKGKNRSGRED